MFMVSTDCHALWLRLWKPCHDPTRFNIEATLFTTRRWQEDSLSAGNLAHIHITQHNFTVTAHDEICSPGYEPSGKCPRAILTGLATLITKKVVTATFVAPGCTLVKYYLLSISNVLKMIRSVEGGVRKTTRKDT